jgi:hypothetical protein
MVSRELNRGQADGFATVVAVFVVVIVGAVIAGGYFVAAQQFRIGKAGRQANAAFYAAEAGINAASAEWSASVADSLEPGETRLLTSGELQTGDRYVVTLTRLDTAQHEHTAYFLATSTGLAHGPWGGRRQVALIVRRQLPDSLCCDAALETQGEVRVSGGAVVSGRDAALDPWGGVEECSNMGGSDRAGVLTDESGQVTVEGGGIIDGVPAEERREGSGVEFLDRAEVWFSELASDPDIEYASGDTVGTVAPAVGGDGGCARSVPTNWGAPGLSGHPCYGYFPVIYAGGDLTISAAGSGQGVLLVEGDLQILGEFDFHGIVVTRGTLTTGSGSGLHGGVLAFNTNGGSVSVSEGGQIGFSSCAVQRALRGSKLYLPHPLAPHAWLEILE